MKSPHVTDLLTAYMDGTLDAKQLERVKSHMIFCHACRVVLADLQKNQSLLKSIPNVQPPEGLAENIFKAVKESQKEAETSKKSDTAGVPLFAWLFSQKGLATAATCLVVGVVVWNFPGVKSNREARDQVGLSQVSSPERPAADLNADLEESLDDRLGNKETIRAKTDVDKLSRMDGPYNKEELQAPLEVETEKITQFRKNKAKKAPLPQLKGQEIARNLQADSKSLTLKESSEGASIRRGSGNKLEEKDQWRASRSRASSSIEKQADFTGLSGAYSGIKDPLEKVISSQRKWKKLWRKHNSFRKPAPPLPTVDFEKNQVIAIFAGNRPTGGSSIRINKVEDTSWEGKPARIISYFISNPPPGGITTMAESQPFTIKILPIIEGKTFFRQSR